MRGIGPARFCVTEVASARWPSEQLAVARASSIPGEVRRAAAREGAAAFDSGQSVD
jgi:hypothetical protein